MPKNTKQKPLTDKQIEAKANAEIKQLKGGVWLGMPPNWHQVRQGIVNRLRADRRYSEFPNGDWNNLSYVPGGGIV
jgi:hypothetical protein